MYWCRMEHTRFELVSSCSRSRRSSFELMLLSAGGWVCWAAYSGTPSVHYSPPADGKGSVI